MKKALRVFTIIIIAVLVLCITGCNKRAIVKPTAKPDQAYVFPDPTEKPETKATSTPKVDAEEKETGEDDAVEEDEEVEEVHNGIEPGVNNVPKDVESKMTSDALIDTYMIYPNMYELVFAEDPVKMYENWFNGQGSLGRQLLARKDTLPKIIKLYQRYVAGEPTYHISEEKDMYYEMDIDWIEMYLAQPAVYAKTNSDQRYEILKTAQKRDDNNFENGYAVTDRLTDLAEVYRK